MITKSLLTLSSSCCKLISSLMCCRGTLFWEDHISIPGLLSAKILVSILFFFLFVSSFLIPQLTWLPHHQLLSVRLLWSSALKALKTWTNICMQYQWNSLLSFLAYIKFSPLFNLSAKVNVWFFSSNSWFFWHQIQHIHVCLFICTLYIKIQFIFPCFAVQISLLKRPIWISIQTRMRKNNNN